MLTKLSLDMNMRFSLQNSVDSGVESNTDWSQYGRDASLGRLSWTLRRFIPIWNPFIAWIAAWAEVGLSKLTKPARRIIIR